MHLQSRKHARLILIKLGIVLSRESRKGTLDLSYVLHDGHWTELKIKHDSTPGQDHDLT